MSQENVETVREWIAAFNRRDEERVLSLVAPDFEFRSIFVAVERVFRAPDGFPGEYFETVDDAYESFVVTADELIDAGAAVLVIGTLDWRGRASGVEGKTPIATVCWLNTGAIFRAETWTDRAQGYAAVGLSEPTEGG